MSDIRQTDFTGIVALDIAAEFNHRVANHLAILAGAVQMKQRAIIRSPGMMPSTEVADILREIAARIVSMSQIHRTLAIEPYEDSIDLSQYLSENSANLISTLGLGTQAIVHHIDGIDCFVPAGNARSIALIMTEVLMNAIKYAHPTGIPVKIDISCRRGTEGNLILEIADDGIGLPEGFDPMCDGGMGFKLIRSLAQSVGAIMSVESDALGTTFRFLFEGMECDADTAGK